MSVMWTDKKIADVLEEEFHWIDDGDEYEYGNKYLAIKEAVKDCEVIIKRMRDEYEVRYQAARAHWWNIHNTDWADDMDVLDEFFGPEPEDTR